MNRLFYFLAGSLCLLSSAHAEIRFDWSNCSTEIQKMCPSAKKSGEIYYCLKQNNLPVSTACSDARKKYEIASEQKTTRK